MSGSRKSEGFTLVEVVIVMGILGLIAGMTAVVSLDTYRGYIFRGERDLALTVMQKARSQAISNICLGVFCADGLPHGVYFDVNGAYVENYVIFQGTSYSTRDVAYDEILATSGNIQMSGPSEVVFTQLSGEATTNPAASWEITLTDPTGKNFVVSLNQEGQIVDRLQN